MVENETSTQSYAMQPLRLKNSKQKFNHNSLTPIKECSMNKNRRNIPERPQSSHVLNLRRITNTNHSFLKRPASGVPDKNFRKLIMINK